MKYFFLPITIMFTICISAQKKEKIKGNKNVVDVYMNLENFSQIEVTDDLEVFLMQTSSNGYHLNTDSNLVEVIKLDVIDDVLKIYTSHKIVSSKKLEIYVTFQDIKKLTINQSTEIEGQNKFNLVDFTLNSSNYAKFNLDIDANNSYFQLDGSSNGTIKFKGQDSKMVINENAYLKGVLSIDNLSLTVNKRADMKIEGSVENLSVIITGSSDINAKNLKATNAKLNASNTSEIYLYVSKMLSIYARGKSFIHVYGNPDITIEGLSDKSQILKK
ncbi:putative autotransporter adhesin-like protein [Xanthomarina spongicola]|uniref:Putative autotransporter adhesin-like protein n=2 Tax=Xanthomarina spongicola TaxID=570520 RepID=A0A316DMS7_9FLAO|nr:putative autotransporter adhesin-like protein [Xanthomarina spongicola]